MPLKKRNKHRTCVIRAMKTRILEISIRVDNYIYRNKPITVEDAEKYEQEISIYRSQCYNDKHILQVTEKLTRCMKTIIEETAEKVQTNKNVESIDLFPKSSELNNKHEDINTKRIDCNRRTTSETVSNITASKSSNEVVNVHTDNTKHLNPVQEYTNIVHKPKKMNNNCNLNPRNSKNKKKSKRKTKSIKNTQQIVTTEKHTATIRPLDLQATLCTKTKKLKGTSEKNKSRITKIKLTKKSLKTSIEKTKKTVVSNFGEHNNTSPSQASASRHKHTYIDIISDEVSLPVANVNNDKLTNVIPNQKIIVKQKDALKINSECVLNDLSWIGDISYVREIDPKELDQTPNNVNEFFWDNFSVPDVCNLDFND